VKIAGEAVLHASVDRVYAALNDPDVLVRTIPGCERLEQVGPNAYTIVVTAGVAAAKGTYVGEVALTDQDAPHAFVLQASGSGAPGTVSASARVRLTGGDDAGTTTLSYEADAVVGGMVGGVGQRILSGVARRTAGEFFAAVDRVLTGAVPAAAQPPAAVPVPPVAGPGTVFTRPPLPAGARPAGARPARTLPGGDFAAGVLVGAAAALVGAIVGGLIARTSGRWRG
jgi:carbon monoxide dehydrogenase subunit G